MPTLAIVASHPIQYYAPLYRQLARNGNLALKVFYGGFPDARAQGAGFDIPFQWDVDLLAGYEHASGEPGARELFAGMADGRWTAVLLHGWHDAFSRRALWRAVRTGTPLLVRGDSHLHAPRPLLRRLAREAACRAILPRFARCLAVGTWNAEFYRHFGVPAERIVLSPHCVDNAFFQREAERHRPDRAALRRAWELSGEARVVLFAGKMIPEKRAHDLLAALAACRRRGTTVHGLFVGDGPLRAMLEGLARRLGVAATFTGFLNQGEIARAYVAADCLALPSGSETWGLVVNEALACGLPCLVSDRAGCAVDMILPGVNGEIHSCGDVEGLAGALERLTRHPSNLPLGGAQWRGVLENHSCERAASGMEQAVAACRR